MKLLFPKNIPFLPSSSSTARRFFLHISDSSTSTNYPSYSCSSSRRHDEESRNVRVSVWWDFENCHLPAGINVFKVAQSITNAVRVHGILGPVQITAFGDVLQLSRVNQEALSSTGINLSHVPNGGKNSADRSLLLDLLYWVSNNPPPAHLFLISGDRDFASVLHRLRMSNYNVLLARPDFASNVLCSAATIMWQWSSLIEGKNLTGKYLNHPPDGPSSSWYGHYRGPLEDPFSSVDQCTYLRSVESSKSVSDIKLRPVPKAVVKQVWHILNAHPKGLSITDFHQELRKRHVAISKDYYGYKKFSHFLLSMPRIVWCQPRSDGKLVVRRTSPKYRKSLGRSGVPLTTFADDNVECNHASTSKLNGEEKNVTRIVDGTPSMASFHELRVEKNPKKLATEADRTAPPMASSCELKMLVRNADGAQSKLLFQNKSDGESEDDKLSFPPFSETQVVQPQNKMQHSCPPSEEVVNLNKLNVQNQSPPAEEEMAKTKAGFLRKIWRKLFGNGILGSRNLKHNSRTSGNHSAEYSFPKMESNGISIDRSEKSQAVGEKGKQTIEEADGLCHIPCSSPFDGTVVDKKLSGGTETCSGSCTRPAFIGWIRRWWPFRESGSNDDLATHQNGEVRNSGKPKLTELNQTVMHSGKPGFFSDSSFWSDMESFVFTLRGALLVFRSRSREDIAHNLQKERPPVIRSLSYNHLLQLVDLLISEKKWIKEGHSKRLPFRLTQPVGKSQLLGQSKESKRSRDNILADCLELVNEILRENPEGYNIGCFQEQFYASCGYPLNIQKLGYQNLASLLRLMPGVRVYNGHIMPADYALSASSDHENSIVNPQGTNGSLTVSNSDSEFSDLVKKDDGTDSLWEELGPICVCGSNQNDAKSKPMQKGIDLKTEIHPGYEPSLANDGSESEEDNYCLNKPEMQRKPKIDEEDGSLLKILGCWYDSNYGGDSTVKSDKTSKGQSDGSSMAESKNGKENSRKKKIYQKSNPSVGNPGLEKKDKLIDGILDSLSKFRNKSDKMKMQN